MIQTNILRAILCFAAITMAVSSVPGFAESNIAASEYRLNGILEVSIHSQKSSKPQNRRSPFSVWVKQDKWKILNLAPTIQLSIDGTADLVQSEKWVSFDGTSYYSLLYDAGQEKWSTAKVQTNNIIPVDQSEDIAVIWYALASAHLLASDKLAHFGPFMNFPECINSFDAKIVNRFIDTGLPKDIVFFPNARLLEQAKSVMRRSYRDAEKLISQGLKGRLLEGEIAAEYAVTEVILTNGVSFPKVFHLCEYFGGKSKGVLSKEFIGTITNVAPVGSVRFFPENLQPDTTVIDLRLPGHEITYHASNQTWLTVKDAKNVGIVRKSVSQPVNSESNERPLSVVLMLVFGALNVVVIVIISTICKNNKRNI